MRHTYHFEGRTFIEDSEVRKTHLVLGQRDEAQERVDDPALDPKFHFGSDEGKMAWAKRTQYVHDLTRGWYAIKPLAWATSAQEADAVVSQFTAQGWINITVNPVPESNVIKHA